MIKKEILQAKALDFVNREKLNCGIWEKMTFKDFVREELNLGLSVTRGDEESNMFWSNIVIRGPKHIVKDLFKYEDVVYCPCDDNEQAQDEIGNVGKLIIDYFNLISDNDNDKTKIEIEKINPVVVLNYHQKKHTSYSLGDIKADEYVGCQNVMTHQTVEDVLRKLAMDFDFRIFSNSILYDDEIKDAKLLRFSKNDKNEDNIYEILANRFMRLVNAK